MAEAHITHTHTWTQVSPTVPGWYWFYRTALRHPTWLKLVQVFGDVTKDGKPCLRYSFRETPMASHLVPAESQDMHWFGPVQDPPTLPVHTR
jgi:hypothetical protein